VRIEHIAVWAKDLEKLKEFYITYFQAKAGERYTNTRKNFNSYFLSFDDGCRLELMQNAGHTGKSE
jgi:lactoylglutathione lyase